MVCTVRMRFGGQVSRQNIALGSNLVCGVKQQQTIKKSVNIAIGTGLACSIVLQVHALGLESIEAPSFFDLPQSADQMKEKTRSKLNEAEQSFLKSDLLRDLRAQSDANREENMKNIKDKYCKRQAELGIGDCGGLRLIPGATQSGVLVACIMKV
eukprot:TRINITY_DN3992_c0_g1_i2.p1 TRINITY_DN3992_c0_g1~~TRINITY_DN3992_c0_g1_i2.p1  ORF type:complete len:155 (-),score=8.50 TRINITY_DN3992_c0_g1_i2:54-518(-)